MSVFEWIAAAFAPAVAWRLLKPYMSPREMAIVALFFIFTVVFAIAGPLVIRAVLSLYTSILSTL